MLENDILLYAVENLKKRIQLPVNIIKSNNINIDAVLQIGNEKEYHVEVKREVHKSNLPYILEHLSILLTDWPLIVAKSISKPAKEIFQRKNINYLDMDGNCLIKNDSGLYIHIDGKKLSIKDEKRKHLAFNKNGIKLIYAFLLDGKLINQSYSVIAKAANISKSTIGSILKDLIERKFLIQVTDEKRRIINKKELLDKWVNSYNEKLKPTLLRGKFRFLPNRLYEWKVMDLGEDSFWGGEPAADLLTDNLSPGEWTIYSNLSKNILLTKLHLIPDPKEGNVTLQSIFWNEENDQFVNHNKQIVNPLLIYSDLINTSDSRNFETATKIYERYLSANFSE